MSFISRISNTAALLLCAAQTTDDVEEADAPTLPPRLSTSHDPLALSTVFRGVQIIETAVSKLPLIQYAPDGSRMRPSTLITRPDLNRSRRDLFGDLVSALALNGNAFLLKVEAGGVLVGVRSLPPQLVTVTDLNMDPANPRLRYSYRGVDYGADRIVHLKLLNVAGRLRGMGPISAAREEIEGAQDTRAYASNWLDNTARPAGILKSDGHSTAVGDEGGYAPTHNSFYSKKPTGDARVDLLHSRDKRIFNDPAGLKSASNTLPFLLQTYVRDTGEVLSEISLPVFINNRHWGALRLGFDTTRMLTLSGHL